MSEQLSRQVCRALDDLGYDEETRKFRIDKYEEENFVRSVCSDRSPICVLLAGSKAEGTSKFTESDFDFLYICSGVKATEYPDIVQGNSELRLFMEEDSAPPGYCKLQFLQSGWDNPWHRRFLRYNCYITCPGYCTRHHLSGYRTRHYLSSAATLHMQYVHLMPVECEKAGPSCKGTLPGRMDRDTVCAIRCAHIPRTFKNWTARYQDHDWPGRQLMEEILKSDIFLVPVGMHGTEQRYLQWRVSFNIPEKILIQNFTAVQTKVYILLKMIKKEVIQPECPESITSYIVKTIMLWTVEQIPSQMWNESKLIDLLFYTLHTLYRCVECGICPMFFIPECNILHGRVTKTTQVIICDKLSSLLSDRISCIVSLPTIQAKLTQYMFVPLAFRGFDEDEMENKSNILMNSVRKSHCNTSIISRLQAYGLISYGDILADLVSIPTPAGSERQKLVKYVFNQTLSHLALWQCVDASTQCGSNIHKYTRVRGGMRMLHGNSHTDVLCGRVRLAQVFHLLGQDKAAHDVLTCGDEKIRYYMPKLSWRSIIQKPFLYHKIETVCENECLSISQILKNFSLLDVVYDHQMELCLPKALQYEVYKSYTGRIECVSTDPETLLYYLKYLCSKKLHERSQAEVAFTNLVWCATRWESNIEYREVALNVLGHCLLKKRLYDQAARVLAKSVMLSKQYSHLDEVAGFRKNAAVFHIAILLNKYFKQRNI